MRHRTSAQTRLYVSKEKNRYFTHMNEACRKWWISYIWIFLGPYGWVLSHSSILTHPYSHVTRECVRVYEWVMSHVWMSHVTRMNESRMNESCHTYEWVMSHVWMGNVYVGTSHVSHMNEACHTWMKHVSHMNARHTSNTPSSILLVSFKKQITILIDLEVARGAGRRRRHSGAKRWILVAFFFLHELPLSVHCVWRAALAVHWLRGFEKIRAACTRIHTHAHTPTHIYVHKHAITELFALTQTSTLRHKRKYQRVKHTRISHTHAHAHTHTYIYIYIYIYIYMYIYIYIYLNRLE